MPIRTALHTVRIKFSERNVTIKVNLLSLQVGIKLNITDKKNNKSSYLEKGFDNKRVKISNESLFSGWYSKAKNMNYELSEF